MVLICTIFKILCGIKIPELRRPICSNSRRLAGFLPNWRSSLNVCSASFAEVVFGNPCTGHQAQLIASRHKLDDRFTAKSLAGRWFPAPMLVCSQSKRGQSAPYGVQGRASIPTSAFVRLARAHQTCASSISLISRSCCGEYSTLGRVWFELLMTVRGDFPSTASCARPRAVAAAFRS